MARVKASQAQADTYTLRQKLPVPTHRSLMCWMAFRDGLPAVLLLAVHTLL